MKVDLRLIKIQVKFRWNSKFNGSKVSKTKWRWNAKRLSVASQLYCRKQHAVLWCKSCFKVKVQVNIVPFEYKTIKCNWGAQIKKGKYIFKSIFLRKFDFYMKKNYNLINMIFKESYWCDHNPLVKKQKKFYFFIYENIMTTLDWIFSKQRKFRFSPF